jgi:hopanoid-associated sugar epimerase
VTVCLTGATGHIGANLVRALLARGKRVRVLLRRGSDDAAVAGLDVERAYGDLRDRRSLEAALEGCEQLYHLAACISIRHLDRQELFEVNVLGTRRLLQAARRAGVRRTVHCSSFGAVGLNPHGASDEEWTLNPYEPVMDYELSKAFAEHEALRAVQQGSDVVLVNPSGVVGPWDVRPSLLGQTILDVARGRLKAYVPGAFDFVPVQDVVLGHLLAMERGRTGERYLLTGEVVTLDQILDWLVELTGAPRPRLRIPPGLALCLAAAQARVQRRLFPQSQPRFTPASIRLLNSGKHGDNGKARRELGFRPTPVRDAFREAVAWFVENGWLERPAETRAAPAPAAPAR